MTRATIISIFGLTLCCSISSMAQQANHSLLSLERIFLKPYIAGSRPGDPTISPDGMIIRFQWDSTAQGKLRHWFVQSDGTRLRMLTDTLLGEIEWSPDGKTIACTRSGDVFLTDTSFQKYDRLTKTGVSENGLQWSPDGKFLVVNSDDRVLAYRTDKPGVYEVTKGSGKEVSINVVDFTPDSKRVLFFESNREGLPDFMVPRFTGKDVSTRSFKGGVSKGRFGLAPVDTGATLWIQFPGDERFFLGSVEIAPDGKRILMERLSANRKKREMYVADTDSGKARLVYEETDKAWIEGGLYTTKWSKDGTHILTTSEKDGWNQLYMMDAAGKHPQQLTEGDWEIHWFDIAPIGETVYFQANRDDHHQWQIYSLDLKTRSITRLSTQVGSYESPTLSKDGSFIAARYSDFAKPHELVRIPTAPAGKISITSREKTITSDERSKELQLTNSIPAEFKSVDWVIPEIVHFRARDGEMVPAMIYKPNNFDPTKKYPLVVFVHGAGYLQNVFRGWSYYYREYMFHQRLTERGYVVYEVEYRGSAGYGRSFRADVYMHLGGKDLADELDGLEYLKHLGYVDSSRVGIYGGSYGGFMALMGLFLSDKYACGAALRAVTSWENYYRHNTWYTEARLGKPEDNAEAYKISSPITYADSLKKPLLILHGMLDDNVFFQDAVQLIAKLQKSKKKFELMVYPDEAHSFAEPESWYDEFVRIEEFFDRNLLKH